MNNPVEKAISILGLSQKKFGALFGASQQAVSLWILDGRIPAKKVLKVWEAINKKIPLYELNSDIYPREG